MQPAFGIPNWITGVVLAALSGIVIFGGLRSIARFSELVVPFMATVYLLLAVVMCRHESGETTRSVHDDHPFCIWFGAGCLARWVIPLLRA